MVINLEEHRKQKQSQAWRVVKLPVYVRVYLEGDKLIGEFENGNKKVITEYGED